MDSLSVLTSFEVIGTRAKWRLTMDRTRAFLSRGSSFRVKLLTAVSGLISPNSQHIWRPEPVAVVVFVWTFSGLADQFVLDLSGYLRIKVSLIQNEWRQARYRRHHDIVVHQMPPYSSPDLRLNRVETEETSISMYSHRLRNPECHGYERRAAQRFFLSDEHVLG